MKSTGCTGKKNRPGAVGGSSPPAGFSPAPGPPFGSGIYAIVDLGSCRRRGLAPLEVAAAFVRAGVAAVQLRAKDGPDAPLEPLGTRIATLCRDAGIPFLINDRIDLVVPTGAAGLHVGQGDLAPAAARLRLGPGFLVGTSTHDPLQVAAANGEPVDYVGFGPVRPTGTKADPDPVVGMEGLAHAVRDSRRPVVAIGGLRLEDLAGVRAAGAHAAALVSALIEGDPGVRAAGAVARWRGGG